MFCKLISNPNTIFYLTINPIQMNMEKLYSKAKRMVLLFLWLAGSYTALAQDRVVTGTVRDESGSPMPGVNVIVAGTSTGTVTDVSGKYSISVGEGKEPGCSSHLSVIPLRR